MRLIEASFLVILGLAASICGQASPSSLPTIPGTVTTAPDWLAGSCPFDVLKFFQMPDGEQNAAPLYFDALLEFSPETAACFPDTLSVRRRKEVAADRIGRWQRIDASLSNRVKAVSGEEIDAFLTEHEQGFRKLAQAQLRPLCVFGIGISIEASLPHGIPMRQVMRIAGLRAGRSLERGDLDRPLDDLELVFRMVRDIRPRGPLMSQLVGNAISQSAYIEIVRPILAHPKLTPKHCDRIIALIADHETKSIDQYDEAMKAEYLMVRVSLRDAAGRPGEPDRAASEKARSEFIRAYITNQLPGPNDEPTPEQLDALRQKLESITPESLLLEIATVDKLYRDMKALSSTPFARRIREVDTLVVKILESQPGKDFASRFPAMIQPIWGFHLQGIGREQATLHAAQCLAACRRWEITRGSQPTNLSEVVKDAKLPHIPIDPYDDQPFRFRRASGRYYVYSIGKDGKDNGGWLDSNYDREPGDLLYRLP